MQGNNNGNSFTISGNTSMNGTYYNIGTFTINNGVTVTVNGNTLVIEAKIIIINGTINANGAGGSGGTGGAQGKGCSVGTNNPDCIHYWAYGGSGGANGSRSWQLFWRWKRW